MTGVKKKNGSFLLLHRSGLVVQTKTLTSQEPIEGITAIINLETLEQYGEEGWEKIPLGYDTIIAAEDELCEDYEYEDDEDDEDEEDDIPVIQMGARRIFNPHIIWAYALHTEKKD